MLRAAAKTRDISDAKCYVHNWPPTLGGLCVYASHTPLPQAWISNCCNVANCTDLYFSDYFSHLSFPTCIFRFVVSELYISDLYIPNRIFRICISRFAFSDLYFTEMYCSICFYRFVFFRLVFSRLYFSGMYFHMCTFRC